MSNKLQSAVSMVVETAEADQKHQDVQRKLVEAMSKLPDESYGSLNKHALSSARQSDGCDQS
jgi:hypothetical protein